MEHNNLLHEGASEAHSAKPEFVRIVSDLINVVRYRLLKSSSIGMLWWSPCSPSTPTIQVRILLEATVFIL